MLQTLLLSQNYFYCLAIANNITELILPASPDDQNALKNFLLERCEPIVKKVLFKTPKLCKQYYKSLLRTAEEMSKKPEFLLENFDLARYTKGDFNLLLIKYTNCTLKHKIWQELRIETGNTKLGSSNLRIVDITDDQQIKEVLNLHLSNQEDAEKNMFLVQMFKEVRGKYKHSVILPLIVILASEIPLNKWRYQHYEIVANRYNNLKPKNWSEINGETVKNLLDEIGEIIRKKPKKILPTPPSLNNPMFEQLCDFIKYFLPQLDGSNNPQINQTIIWAILNHFCDIAQTNIAQTYNINQSNVSRSLKNLYQEISKNYFDFCQIQNPSPEQLSLLKKLLKNNTVSDIDSKDDISGLRAFFKREFNHIFMSKIYDYNDVDQWEKIRTMTSILTQITEQSFKIKIDDYTQNHVSLWVQEKISYLQTI